MRCLLGLMNENTRDGFENFSETSIDEFLSGHSDNDSSRSKYNQKNIFSDVIFDTSKIFTFSGDKRTPTTPKGRNNDGTTKQRPNGKRRHEDAFTSSAEEDRLEAKIAKVQRKTMADIECIKVSVVEIAKTLKELTNEIKEVKEAQLRLVKCLEETNRSNNSNNNCTEPHINNPEVIKRGGREEKYGDMVNDLFVE